MSTDKTGMRGVSRGEREVKGGGVKGGEGGHGVKEERKQRAAEGSGGSRAATPTRTRQAGRGRRDVGG